MERFSDQIACWAKIKFKRIKRGVEQYILI